jgi:alpha-tubulin suppressor-like RCC1 family protein
MQVVPSGVVAVAAGSIHTLFLKSDGSVWAIGFNGFGQLGDGFNTDSSVPEQIIPPPQPQLMPPISSTASSPLCVTVSAGVYNSLFTKSDGSLWAMGLNNYGQLGDGTYSQINAPEKIASGVTSVACGSTYDASGATQNHTLFVKSDGSLWAMGYDSSGELGDGTSGRTNTPEQIVSSGVTAVAAGTHHSLFVKNDGSLWAMGLNSFGQCGISVPKTNQPVRVVAAGVTAVAAAKAHSLFLKTDGSLWAMGVNTVGQLGDPSITVSTNQPDQIVSSNVIAIAAGTSFSLFLKNDGSVWAMGYNLKGQLGDGTTNSVFQPERVVTNGVVAVSAGDSHSLFIKSDGSLWGMGDNSFGQLGLGITNNVLRPRLIVPNGVTGVSAGYLHTLFVKSDGSLWGMGDDGASALGNSSGSTKVPQILLSGVGAVSVGSTCFVGGTYSMLSTTNAAKPLLAWDWMGNRSVSARGPNNYSFIFTNGYDFRQRYYVLRLDN